MKLQKRNLTRIWYQTYEGMTAHTETDEYGNVLETGEYEVSYADPRALDASVSTATGTVQTELFGGFTDYDKVVLTDDLKCPIDEQSVLWVDHKPTYVEGVLQGSHDYIVKRIAKSLNFIAYAIRKVEVSE